MLTEICCNSIDSAKNALQGGADRIELCKNLEIGGVTPSMEDVDYCINTLGLRTHVLIRPRGGDFCYNSEEFSQIKTDVWKCKNLGVHAVVIGFLTKDGQIDKELTKEIVTLASPMEVTFHRAFDEIAEDPIEALEDVISTGCTRILTSGCKPTAIEGIETIKKLVDKSAGRIIILAGSGVTPGNVAEIVNVTKVSEVHGSCKSVQPDGSIATDAEIVSKLVKAAKL